MNRNLLRSLAGCAIISLITSCGKEPAVPAYIHIPAISVATDYNNEGSTSSKITDAWVYVDDQLLGVYTLPATFPIQHTGSTDIKVVGGIQLNGIAATRAAYPLYTDTIVTAELEETKTDTINSTVRYFSTAEFLLKEDFEAGNAFDEMDKVGGAEAFQGASSGKMLIDTFGVVTSVSVERFQIPSNSTAVFLEFDYKNDHIFAVGMNIYKDGQSVSFDKVTINKQGDWNKVYINFTPEVLRSQGDEYEIVFKVNTSNETVTPNIYLDNIKLVYLP